LQTNDELAKSVPVLRLLSQKETDLLHFMLYQMENRRLHSILRHVRLLSSMITRKEIKDLF
jgi:hypothetical protein